MSDTGAGPGTSDLVVYTAVFGAGYALPARPPGGADAVCFTDQADLEPNGWSVRVVRALLPADPPRSSREQKIRPYRWLPDHARSLYIDPSVELLTDPEALWDELVGDDTAVWFGAFRHSYRETVLGEVDAVLRAGFDAPERVHEQVRAMVLTERESLDLRPVWGGVLARRHLDARCEPAMEDWYAQVLRYSRRDQLSLPGALHRADPAGVHLVEGDNHETRWHCWPRADYVRPATYAPGATEALVPDVLRAERATTRVRELETQVAELRTEQAALRARVQEVDDALAQRDSAVRDRDVAVRERDRVVGSRTWRWTGWLRGMRRAAHRG